ncbi:hypothetical protein CJ030_MR8G028148 [Morella rubra]|uniref:Serine-threonine/tyrosine-protein kinase catalytic domain-containing protein n=1 Tax=Morella rubra TaxID=262757 RepID=A0A6A1UWJ4_9ROSI|nr:hypothetical protein CJ030_MR8G028148 [Morella rubra]
MGQMRHVLLLLAFIQIVVIAAETDGRDTAFLMSLEKSWQNPPHNWVGSDPCGSLWVGIGCNNSRVNSISLTDCGLYGPIPGTIGSLQQLIFLDLNSNKFSGKIPNSIGNLSNLLYLDFTGNQLDGSIPVSVGTLPGLDMLLQAKHLRLDRNSLSSPLPTTLLNLTNVSELYLSNNLLTGPMLNLTGMNLLSYLLGGNPICENTNSVARSYCPVAPSNSPYSTPPKNCSQVSCGSNQVASPHCKCAYPYTVSIFFMTLSSLDLGNSSYYSVLEELLIQKFQSSELPVDSISPSNPMMESSGYLELTLEVFPSANWDPVLGSGGAPQLKGAKQFFFEELKKYTNSFSEANAIGSGGYGKGYMDPEYYMTQQLTEKSDVYSFGVLMLELITARKPIERGKFIVREVRNVMDKTKVLYNLQEILDPAIGLGKTLEGLEKYADLAMRCVEEAGADRPTMGEVAKEIEDIMQLAGMNPNADSVHTSTSTYDEVSKGSSHLPYSEDAFGYSGSFPPSTVKSK